MMTSRRESLAVLLASPFLALSAGLRGGEAAAGTTAIAGDLGQAAQNFRLAGTYLNAAYIHPLPLDAAAAMRAYVDGRTDPVDRRPPGPSAKELFAKLINASPDEIALVPSTSYGESFVIGALGLQGDRRAKIVTDILHFDGSLYTLGELAKQGSELTVLPMGPDGRIDMNALEAAVDDRTRLVSISLVSMVNGFEHDLKTVCEIAHRKGARVYVDAVQGAGAVPIDVRASGVDFMACSTFKWLMGDFGCGFLYVRRDLLPTLTRREFGYHQPESLEYHFLPGDPPGRALFEASPDNKTAMGYFEVGSLGKAAEVAATVSLGNLLRIGVENIQTARQPLMDSLQQRLSRRYKPLTPTGSKTSIIAFSLVDAVGKLSDRITESKINIQLYDNRFRISPSIYNSMDDIDRVVSVLSA